MFGLSIEHFVIIGVVLLFFGPRRLPQLGESLGKSIKNFKDAFSGIEEAQAKKVELPTEEKTNALEEQKKE